MTELEIKPTPMMMLRVVGVIVSACVIVAVLVWMLTGGGVGLLARKVEMKTYLPDATGLGVGAPVRLDGIQIGSVKNIAISGYLDMQRAVRVGLKVDTKYLSRIPVDSQTSIGSDTLIGDKFLDIAAGKERRLAGDGSELKSEPAATAADKADLLFSIQDSMRKVDAMLISVSSPESAMGRYILGDKEYNRFVASIELFERSMRALASGGTPTVDAVFSQSLYSKWDKSIREIDNTLGAIQRGEGPQGRLYASDAQYTSLLTQVRDLRKSAASFRASLAKQGQGLRDEETYRNLTRSLASMDATLSALNRGDGKAGDLLNNPQMYVSLSASVRSLAEMLKDFRGNPKKYMRMKVF